MWQVLRFLYFHQSVYIYIYLFLSLAQSLLPPPCYLPLSYFVCAHVLRTFFQIQISYRVSHDYHTVRTGLHDNFNSRNIVSQLLLHCRRNPPSDLWTDILSISLVFVRHDCIFVLFVSRIVHRRGGGRGGSFWTLWTIRR